MMAIGRAPVYRFVIDFGVSVDINVRWRVPG